MCNVLIDHHLASCSNIAESIHNLLQLAAQVVNDYNEHHIAVHRNIFNFLQCAQTLFAPLTLNLKPPPWVRGGGTPILKHGVLSEILKRTPKMHQDPVLWAWLETSPLSGTISHITHYHFFQLKGTTKAPTMDFLQVHTQEVRKLCLFTPQRLASIPICLYGSPPNCRATLSQI